MSSMYVFAPAGPAELRSSRLKIGIEYIGSRVKGIGSPFAKGKRYIKDVVGCSGKAIKRACNEYIKLQNHDYYEHGLDVYYYHKEMAALVVDFVISYICKNRSDPALPQVFSGLDYNQLLELMYGHRITQLKWVCNNNYKKQREDAQKIYIDFSSLKK